MIRVGTFCSGIGAPEQALKNKQINHQVLFASEIDKSARETYKANHQVINFYDDLTKIDFNLLPDIDLFIAGFPCQAFSIAGHRKGFDDDRGNIFFYIHEYLKIKRPDIFILENVKGLLSHDQGNTFDVIIKSLASSINGTELLFKDENSLNYDVFYKVLNSKDYGVPQNRERIFIVGFKKNFNFKFPEKRKDKITLADILESNPDEKYYLSDKAIKGLLFHKEKQKEKGRGFGCNILDKNQIANTLLSRYYKDGSDILIKETARNPQGMRINSDKMAVTLSSGGGGLGAKTGLYAISKNNTYRVRRLTPLECFRLMGFPDTFKRIGSDSQLYKQAGNSIVVNVLEDIITECLKFFA